MQAPIIVPSSDVEGLVETVPLLGSGSEELEGKGGGMEGWRGGEREGGEGEGGKGREGKGREGKGEREERGERERRTKK